MCVILKPCVIDIFISCSGVVNGARLQTKVFIMNNETIYKQLVYWFIYAIKVMT